MHCPKKYCESFNTYGKVSMKKNYLLRTRPQSSDPPQSIQNGLKRTILWEKKIENKTKSFQNTFFLKKLNSVFFNDTFPRIQEY